MLTWNRRDSTPLSTAPRVSNQFYCIRRESYIYISIYIYHHHHHHHHVVPLARISPILSRHFSLSFIASGRSSGLHPVYSHSYCMYVRAGHPAFARPYVGVHRSISARPRFSSNVLHIWSTLDLIIKTHFVRIILRSFQVSWYTGVYIYIYIYIYIKVADHSRGRPEGFFWNLRSQEK